MKPFEKLTRIGQVRRLGALSRSVLEGEYGLTDVKVRLVAAHSFNSIFRVDAVGVRAALRIGSEHRIHPAGTEDVEADWLDVLAANGVLAPRNLPTADGRRWTLASDASVPGDRVCSLFSWIEGVDLRDRTTPKAIQGAGRLLAQLHRLAAHIPTNKPPELHANRAVYFAGEDLVSTTPHSDRALFAEAIDRVQTSLDAFWQQQSAEPHLLHGDFGPHNILSRRGQLRPIDFQDLRVGYRQQDLGLTIADLARRDPALITPFLEGYQAIEPQPELGPRLLAVFAAQRSLNIMNLALFAPDTNIAAAFDSHADRIREWMITRP